jgi:mono/diheme cytochrome c family protein
MISRPSLSWLCEHRWFTALAFSSLFWVARPESSKGVGDTVSDRDHAAKMTKGLAIFKDQVRPVLMKGCVRCHGGKKTESEFDLVDRDALLRGGKSGPAVVPGNSKDSLLCKLIAHTREPYMPNSSPQLSAEAIRSIAAWIDCGAPYDAPLVPRAHDTSAWTRKTVPDSARQFWSFQPLRQSLPPKVRNSNWVGTPIDQFILAKLDAAGIQPNAPADKRRLIRRLYLDLIGLPPPPQAVEAFVNDSSPDAYELLVDQLLASPHYGERWGRHWLDLARFAESHGFEHDYDRPSAYHYRDFVIKALNADLPYDTFVRWQLAGDEIEPENRLALMATGFLAAGVHSTQITKNEVEKHRYDEMDDMAATIGTAFLGLTIGCARCHDHKYDPIPQADYYRFISNFTTTIRSDVDLDFNPDVYRLAKLNFDREHALVVEEFRSFESVELPVYFERWQERANKTIWKLVIPAGEHRTSPNGAALMKWYRFVDPGWRKQVRLLWAHFGKAPKPKLTKVLIASEGLAPVRLHTQGEDFLKETNFLARGDPGQKQGVAGPSYVQVLMNVPEREEHWRLKPPAGWRTSYRRRALADWITDVDHGAGQLLARVIVNRLWQHHMGRGIVATPSEFGTRGEPPSHPELLDWLARQLIDNGWHLKPIHKLILTSTVYRQSGKLDEAKLRIDRDNRLFWHGPHYRLEAEAIRDSLLAVSGSLDDRMFGPGTLNPNTTRRSVYFTVKHSSLIPMMTVFDAPDASQSVGERPTTTIAPQALFLMNNPNVRQYAISFARRIAPETRNALESAIERAYMTALARPPDAGELAEAVSFVKHQTESYQLTKKSDPQEAALADFCQVVFCLNEFIYVD